MEDYKDKRGDFDSSIDFIKPHLIHENNTSFTELKNEYTKAFNYIDILKLEKNNLMNTMKLARKQDPNQNQNQNPFTMTSSKSQSQLKGVIVPQNQNDKRISQLEQENRELRKTLVESKRSPAILIETEKRALELEQVNLELQRNLDITSDKLNQIQRENHLKQQDRSNDIERLEKLNRHLNNEVQYLNQELDAVTRRFQVLEDENSRMVANAPDSSPVILELNQNLIKYSNYILNSVTSFPENHYIRNCFDERYTSPFEVHKQLNMKDYASLLLKSFKYISDLLMNVENANKSPSGNMRPQSARSQTPSIAETSDGLSQKSSMLNTSRRKIAGSNRPVTPLSSSSLASGAQNVSGSGQTFSAYVAAEQAKEKKYQPIKRSGRNLSQQLKPSDYNKESQSLMANMSPKQNLKSVSIVPDVYPQSTRNNILAKAFQRGPQTTRNEDRTKERPVSISGALRDPSKIDRTSETRENRSRLDNPISARGLEESFLEREKAILETEKRLMEMDRELKQKDQELKRVVGRNTPSDLRDESYANYRGVLFEDERRSGNRKSETSGFMSNRERDRDFEERYDEPTRPQKDEDSMIRLKPMLKEARINKEKGYEDYHEEETFRPKKEPESWRQNLMKAPQDKYPTLGEESPVPVAPQFENFAAPERDLSNQEKSRERSPIHQQIYELRSRIKSGLERGSSFRNESLREDETPPRPRRDERDQEYSSRFADEGPYQPKVLPRPQPVDRLEDLNNRSRVGNFSPISNGNFTNRFCEGYDEYDSIIEPRDHNRDNNNDVERNRGEDESIYEQRSGSRLTGMSRSAANSRPRGTNYSSFQVSFGRTQSKTRLDPNQDPIASPSVMDVTKRKRVDHVYQTYDIIKGEEMKSKARENRTTSQYDVSPTTPVNGGNKR